jgi:hypothetical protein
MSVDLVSREELEKLCPGITHEYDDTDTPAVIITKTGEPIVLTFNDKSDIVELIERLSELLEAQGDLGVVIKGQITTIGDMTTAELVTELEPSLVS